MGTHPTYRPLALAALLLALSLSAAAADYSITIPKVLTYPTTTVTFKPGAILGGDRYIPGDEVEVSFNGANWLAHVTRVHWITTAGGTEIALECDPNSRPCMSATKGSGTYAYTLAPPSQAAPSKPGTYSLTWDVYPPGDLSEDATVISPEPGTLLMLGLGSLGLAAVFGCRQRSRYFSDNA